MALKALRVCPGPLLNELSTGLSTSKHEEGRGHLCGKLTPSIILYYGILYYSIVYYNTMVLQYIIIYYRML